MIILRGLPGSGKSTYTESLKRSKEGTWTNVIVCNADDYHKDEEGNYLFDIKNVGMAHGKCLMKYVHALAANHMNQDSTVLVVDNTNTQTHEIAPYYALAQTYNLPVKIVRLDCSFAKSCRSNIHRVPATTIWRMHQNILTERLPPHWVEEICYRTALGNWAVYGETTNNNG